MLIKRLLKFKDVTDTSGVNKRTMFLSKNFRSVGIETNHPITLVERKCLVFFFFLSIQVVTPPAPQLSKR